ncbi:hypothetical protein [Pseudomonas koreensis]|uniref:Uncharacterized protein n=1 Tax=Pseudomonas koreensis TaxID=198620 RepID=A0AA94EWL4_9PSED|nr:hypothetical protein [Pseudomonas koreensis]RVD79916.1 hypothetical protein A9HBioS_0440 [Pseudomonas koreensis]
MSSSEQFREKHHIGEKAVAEGEIKGKVINLSNQHEINFTSDWIWRDELNGALRFHGTMPEPGGSGRSLLIGLSFKDKSQPSGTYDVKDPQIVYLTLKTFGAGEPDCEFEASSGHVILEHHPNNDINGKLVFKTKTVGVDSFSVNVVFDVRKF